MITKIGFMYVPTKIDTIEIDKINGVTINLIAQSPSIDFPFDMGKQIATEYLSGNLCNDCLFVECTYFYGTLMATNFEWANEEDFKEPSIEIVTREEEECDK